MSLPDQDGSDVQAARKTQGSFPVSMPDQLTLAISICLLSVVATVYFLISAIWQPDFVRYETAPRLASTFKVKINSAAWPEIAALPGIGPTRARQIVEWRETNGPFASLDDLGKIHGIGPVTLQIIGPFLILSEQSNRHVVARPPFPVENPQLNPAAQ